MVVDKRAKKLAEIVVNYSLSINQKDKLLIRVEDKLKEFAEEIGNTAMEKGAKVIYDLISLDSERKLIERDNIDELKKESKILCGLAKEITASVRVHSKSDPLYLQKVDPNKIVRYEKEALTQFREIIMGDGQKNPGKKWATIAFPTKGEAEQAKMKLEDYEKFVYFATNRNWQEEAKKMQKIKNCLIMQRKLGFLFLEKQIYI